MAYNSAHTGPEIDAAVEMLGQIQSARDATSSDRAAVVTLASQVAASANQVASQASTVSTKTAQVLESATAVEQAHAEVLSASESAVESKEAAALSAGAAQESQASAGASEFAASQSQLAAGLSEQISAENAASTSEDRTVVDELARQVEAASASAALSAQNAAAVVSGGTAALASSPGKIPLANAQGKIDPGWLGAEIARTSAIQGAIDTAQSAEDSADLATARTARFLASVSTPPVIRDDGTPLQLGDRYVNAENQAEYIYKSSGWVVNDSLEAIVDIRDETDPDKGAAQVGWDGETVGAQLDQAKKLANYTALGNYRGSATRIELTQSGIAGPILRDPTVTVGDGGTTFLDGLGRGWRRVIEEVVHANWFGIPDSAATLAIFNAGAGKTIVFDGTKTYPYSAFSIAANTKVVTHGATFDRGAASTSHGVTINSCVDIDTLKLTSPGGPAGDKAVLIKGDIVSIGHLEGIASAEGSFTSSNWFLECESRPTNTQLKDIHIGRLVTKNYRTSLFAKYVDGLNVDSISVDTYRLAVYLQDVTNSNFPSASITGKSATLTGDPGENGLLCEASKAAFSMRNVRFGNWRVEDSGEHGYRLGGHLSMSEIYFDNCVSVRPGQAWTVGYPQATEWHGGSGFKVLGGTGTVGQRHKNIYLTKCNVYDCSLNFGNFPAGHGVNNFTSFLISCADNVHLTDCGADALDQQYSARNTVLISSCDGVYLNNNNMLKAQVTALNPYEENLLVSQGYVGLAFGVNELHVNGGVYEVTNTTANSGIPFNALGTAYANKNWSIGGGAILRGGSRAVYITNPTTGAYTGIIDFAFTYSDSNSNDSTYTTPVVDGAAVASLTVKAPWRPLAYSPSGLNGSTWQDTLGGIFRRKDGGAWLSTPNPPSGSWTPAPTLVTNLSAGTASTGRYSQQGNTVSLSGVATVTPTAAGSFQLDLSIPVPSNFTTFTDVAGTVMSDQGDVWGIVKAETVNDRLSIVAKATLGASARNIYYTAQYTVK